MTEENGVEGEDTPASTPAHTKGSRKSYFSPSKGGVRFFGGESESGNDSRMSSHSFMKRVSQNLSVTFLSLGATPSSALPEGLKDDAVLIEGVLQKQGKKHSDEFLSRYLRITKQHVAYGVAEDARAIDNILFTDIVGVQMGLMESETELDSPLMREIADGYNHWKTGDFATEKANAGRKVLGPCDFLIATSQHGHYDGRIYVLKADSPDSKEKWAETIRRVMIEYDEFDCPVVSRLQKVRRKVRWFYVGDRSQVFVAALIMGNFTMNIFEAHFTAEPGTPIANTFENIDLAFTIIFTIELLVNMFATLVSEFVGDAWNWFDVVVVLVSLMSLGLQNLPGADVLRLLRCFRVFRLFKRIPSLRQIIVALSASVPPMINAFALVCLVTAIYAIMSVTFFSTKSPEEFGDFFTAMFTMFQVMTGDNWSEIARNLFVETGNGAAVGIFFVSFQLIVALVLVNVVIAVLLDEFSKAADKRSAEGGEASMQSSKCPFERLSKELSAYRDLEDLETRIEQMFAKISQMSPAVWGAGTDEMGGMVDQFRLNYTEFRAGVKSIDLVPPVLVSPADWEEQIVKARFAVEGTIGLKGFTGLMKQAVRRFQMRRINQAMESEAEEWGKENMQAMFLGVKGLLAEDQEQYRIASGSNGSGAATGGVASSEDNAVSEALLKRLVADMSKMHKRFDVVEKELNTIQNTKISQGPKLSGRGKSELKGQRSIVLEELETPAVPKLSAPPTSAARAKDRSEDAQKKVENKAAESFIGEQASARRGAAAVGNAKASAPSMNGDRGSEVPASSRELQLTHRGGAGASPEAVRETGWNFLAQQFGGPSMGRTPSARPKEQQSNGEEQKGDAVNNIVGGFLGGFSAIGNNIPFLAQNGAAANGAKERA